MLRLRLLEHEDLATIVEWNKDKDASYLYQWAGRSYTYPLTQEQLNNALTECQNQLANDCRTVLFAIETAHDNRLIGVVELSQIDRTKGTASVCRFLIGDSANRGKGYGKAALALLAQMAKDIYQVEKLFLKVFDINIAGIRCYEKVGFRKVDFEENVYHDGDKSWGRYFMAYHMA